MPLRSHPDSEEVVPGVLVLERKSWSVAGSWKVLQLEACWVVVELEACWVETHEDEVVPGGLVLKSWPDCS